MLHLYKKSAETDPHEGILVLVYHSYHLNFPQYFEKHISYLKKYFHILSPQDFDECYHSGRVIRERAVLITLDDGIRTDYTVAYPILKKHRAHAIAFVITDPYYTDISGRDWWKEVGAVMEIGSHTVSHAEVFISNLLTGFVTPTHGKIEKMYCMVKGVEYQPGFPLYQKGPELINRQVTPPDELIETIREVVQEEGFFRKKDWYKKLERIVHRHPYSYRYETDEMRQERIKKEILESKLEIERVTNQECRFFAYPWGAYDEEVIRKVREAKYQFAFTANQGLVHQGNAPFTLNRINVSLESLRISLEEIISKFFSNS